MIFFCTSTQPGLFASQLPSAPRDKSDSVGDTVDAPWGTWRLMGHLVPKSSVADHTRQLRARRVSIDWDFTVQPRCLSPALQTLLLTASVFLKVWDITLWRNVQCLRFSQDFLAGHSPSRVLLEYLVDTNLERFVIEAFADVILIYSELGSRHCFPLWDSGEIKPELSVVAALMVKLSVMLHWNRKTAH